MEDKGLRYNKGKLRYDLTPSFAQEQYVKVMTRGSEKYADRNWEMGMKWTTVLASMERHLAEFKKGKDYDPESGVLHTAHIMANAAFLTEYYKIYPQGDDRPHSYLNIPKIALDVDEVLADFVGGMMDRFPEMGDRSQYWNCPKLRDKYTTINKDEDFWMSLKPRVESIPFEPVAYITSRSISSVITKAWLDKNEFPTAPIYTVPYGASKVDSVRASGADIFVDDKFETFVELNKAGICCYLMDAAHNRRYDVGFKRIKELSELI